MVVSGHGVSCWVVGSGEWSWGVIVGHAVVVGGGKWSWGVALGRAVVVSGHKWSWVVWW